MKQKKRRNRGVILTPRAWTRLQTAIAQAECEENAHDKFSQEELSDRMGLALHTTSKILGRSEAVDKGSLQAAFAAFGLEFCKCDYTQPISPVEEIETRTENPQSDWGEAPYSSLFYGRSMELVQLRQWLVEEKCRLVGLLGIGGIGKSTLAVKLGLQVQTEFEVVVWRSLHNAPPAEEMLANILQFVLLALQLDVMLPESFSGKLSKLMECLTNHRCLLILDNAETILASGGQAGQCRPGYEDYIQLLKSVGTIPHKSCVLFTSREKPREMLALEGEGTGIRSLLLKGLNSAEGQKLFQQKGTFIGTEEEWQRLIEHYGGNPLALKMVAAGTQELFNARIAGVLEYGEQGVLIFEDVRDLLESQFHRLSVVEQEVMYWLAINPEPVSLANLASDLVISSSERQLPQAIKSLLQRSLIEKSGEYFFLQPVVMEYTTQRLIEEVSQEIRVWGQPTEAGGIQDSKVQIKIYLTPNTRHPTPLFQTHALIKATAKNYIWETQKQLIIQPLVEQLLIELGSQEKLMLLLKNVLEQQRYKSPIIAGYVGGNSLNLLVHLQVNLRGYDLSNLTIWQAQIKSKLETRNEVSEI